MTRSDSFPPGFNIASSLMPSVFKPFEDQKPLDDTILLAEFSEVEGPLPLLAIPHPPAENLDLNSLAVRIMSTDYQNTNGGLFRLNTDTHILQEHVDTNLHVIVHYFTLCDIRARGFVRPVCLAYVSSDLRKLREVFWKICESFIEVAELLKHSNIERFQIELQYLITSLEIAQRSNCPLECLPEGNLANSVAKESKETDSSNNSCGITCTQHTMQEQLSSQLVDFRRICNAVQCVQINSDIVCELETLKDAVKSKPLSPLCREVVKVEFMQSTLLQSGNCITSAVNRKRNKEMTPVSDLCGLGYIAGVLKLRAIRGQWGRSLLTLMFEELDQDLLNNPKNCLFIGDIPIVRVCPSVPSLASRKAKQTPLSPNAYMTACWDWELIALLTPESTHFPYVNPNPAPRQSRPASASDCLEVFACSESSPESQFVDWSAVADDYLLGSASNDVTSSIDTVSNSTDLVSAGIIANEEGTDILNLSLSSKEDIPSDFEEFEDEEAVEEEVTLALQRHQIPACDIDNRMSGARKNQLARFVHQFCGISQCILHSLLSGRPVLLAGSEIYRSVVTQSVKTLSTLLPRVPRQPLSALKWHKGTVTSHHLNQFKIMGICIPERLRAHDLMSDDTLNRVTLLNLESGHISGLAYNGRLVAGITMYGRKMFLSDGALQTALQALVICLGLKVYIFHHVSQASDRSADEILRGLGVVRDDWGTLKYLADFNGMMNQETLPA